jgi:hypothetical protein
MFRALRAATLGPGAGSDLLRPRRLVSNPIVEHAAFRNPLEGIEGTIMTEKPAPKTTNEVFTPIRDLPSAPIIFFEFCPTLGNHNGLINIMLAAGIVMPSGGPTTDVVPVAVAHLRCTAAAAIQLRDAIDKALLIGAPVQNPEGKAN